MKLSIRVKNLILFAAVAVLGFVSLAIFGHLNEEQVVSKTVSHLHAEAKSIVASSLISAEPDEEALQLLSAAVSGDIWLISLDGNVLASAGETPAPKTVPNFRLGSANTPYMTGDFFGCFTANTLSVYAPAFTDLTLDGYVFIHYPMSKIRDESNQMLLFSYIIYGIMLLLFAFVLVFLNLHVAAPIAKVAKAGREFANGNLTFPLNVRRNDEIGEAAEAERELAHQLSSASDDQHKFLANVSHDFRSPLTSIRGYIAAIEDGTIPPELQGKYLNVVLSETDRLTNLANDLLDLNQLEKGIMLNRTDFDVNALIRELLSSFEGRAREKHVVFDCTFEEESLDVNADRERIVQVIHNLVDNAIKFSPQDSEIRLATRLVGEKVFISVKDSGVGIEKENLPKIWTRFYKTDASRGKDKKGTGLGLSIVREIIQAHKESIDVISTPGVGTEFIFTLTAAQ